MFVKRKVFEAMVSQRESDVQTIKRMLQTSVDNINLLQVKEGIIFQLQEKVRQLQKKPFKK